MKYKKSVAYIPKLCLDDCIQMKRGRGNHFIIGEKFQWRLIVTNMPRL